MSTITEATIRERLAADRRKPCRLATWEEIAYLLDALDAVRAEQPFIWLLGFGACQRGEDATRNPYDLRST